MVEITFTEEEIEKLHYERFHHPHSRVQQRCEVVYLKALGLSHQDIGRIVRISQPTVRSYLALYHAGGLAKLKELDFHCPTSALNEHRPTLEAEFKTHPPQTINEALERIEQLTGIRRSPTQVRQFLKDLGLKRLKVGQVPAKANPEQQAVFLEKNSSPGWKKRVRVGGTSSSWTPRILCSSRFSVSCGALPGSSFKRPVVGNG